MKTTIEIRNTLRRPKSAREPAGERNRDGGGDDVGGQHPAHLVLGGRQGALHARQRDVGDGGVERLHDGRQHHRDRDEAVVGHRHELRLAAAMTLGSRRRQRLPAGVTRFLQRAAGAISHRLSPATEGAVMFGIDFRHHAHAGGERHSRPGRRRWRVAPAGAARPSPSCRTRFPAAAARSSRPCRGWCCAPCR